jgi:hypothetical protein
MIKDRIELDEEIEAQQGFAHKPTFAQKVRRLHKKSIT